MKHVTYLTIGPVTWRLSCERPLTLCSDCANFFQEEEPEEGHRLVDCEIVLVREDIPIEGKMIYQTPSRAIFQKDQLEQRINLFNGRIEGIYRELGENRIQVCIHDEGQPKILISTYFLELLAIDVPLLQENALVLHSSFIGYNGKSILFTAPSGTGKSTQAGLWEKYEGVPVLNGDRSVVHYDGERFLSHGLPFCGSSQIHEKATLPLGAIVFIEQWPTNIAEPMRPGDAGGKLYGEMSINSWNRQAVLKSLDLIERLVKTIPMVHLKCNRKQEAVNTLKNYLNQTDFHD